MPRRVLVLGGARSGKSTLAEQLVAAMPPPVVYVATATQTDAEMAERIARHRQHRPSQWQTLETPLEVAAAVAGLKPTPSTLLLEDLTLLLANAMHHASQTTPDPPRSAEAAERWVLQQFDSLMASPANLVVVSNEVGMGLVPEHPVSRAFRDALGRVNQYAAGCMDEVLFVVAGLAMPLKSAR
jgi:adenosylcobinamide kinase / adenosylcobinamide-phosphate guanylyltransferase